MLSAAFSSSAEGNRAARKGPGPPTQRQLAVWQLNLLRLGYLFMGGGLALLKWPLLFGHEPWGLAEGTKECMLIAMSFLAFLGLRYPQRMLPILLFEVTWKLLWLAVVVLPLWSANQLDAATSAQFADVLWFVGVIAVIPWRHVLNQYVLAPGDPWQGREEITAAMQFRMPWTGTRAAAREGVGTPRP